MKNYINHIFFYKNMYFFTLFIKKFVFKENIPYNCKIFFHYFNILKI